MIWEETPNNLKCPYCGAGTDDQCELREHPYPYKRGEAQVPKELRDRIDFLQYIRLFGCCACGETFYYSMRMGMDMGLGNTNLYCQTYKYGHYHFREGDSVIILTATKKLKATYTQLEGKIYHAKVS